MPQAALDYRPLEVQPSRAEVAVFRREALRSGRLRPEPIVGPLAFAAFPIAILATVAVFFLDELLPAPASNGGSAAVLAGAVVPVVLGGAVLAFAIVVTSTVRRRSRRWERMLRQERFGAANGLQFSPVDAEPRYPGMIFQRGTRRMALEHYRSLGAPILDFGNYRCTLGRDSGSTPREWGFLAIALERDLPHMVLDSTATRSLFPQSSAFPDLRRDQVLSLEGDFDRYFTLYCPRDYERDALYVFTSDLMALLIDNAAEFDVEIVDRWLFVYSDRPFDMADAATIARLMRIVNTVGAKAVAQTDSYRDDRVDSYSTPPDASAPDSRATSATGPRPAPIGADAVAPLGRRLRTRFSVSGYLVVAAMAGVFVWHAVSGTGD